MTDPLFHQVNDLSELISKARDGFSTESRAQWYPRLPKIVLGMCTTCLASFYSLFCWDFPQFDFTTTDGTEVSEMSYSDLLLTCEKKFKVPIV